MPSEIEIKFRITGLKALAEKLQVQGFHLITPRTHEMNTLYDASGNPLRRRGALLRVRQYGNQWTLTFKSQAKRQPARHKLREEIETRIENGEALAGIFKALGFEQRFQYEKFRSEWADDTGHVVIDETPIGNFGEIEGPGKWIDEVAKRLEISPAEYITASYTELFADWKRQNKSKAKNMLFSAA